MNRTAARFLTVFVILAATACTTSAPAVRESPDVVESGIKHLIEALRLDTAALEEQYRLLRASAANEAFAGNDLQLNYTQKSAIYVQNALDAARHQWEVLSIVDYIKQEALRDYFTLRLEGIRQAATDLNLEMVLVDMYGTMLESEDTRQDVANSLTVLRTIQQHYNQLLSALEPLGNARSQQTALLEPPRF